MTRTAEDARYRPRPGDTRQRADGDTRTVTRATDWAVEHWCTNDRHFRPEDTLTVESIDDWAEGGEWGRVYVPKQRTAEDARFDPQPGDTKRVVLSPSEVAYARVVARDGDNVEVQVDTSVGDWSLDFWAGGGWGDVWTPAS